MKEIIDKIIEEGFECYIVGGYVRDYLLGYDSKDIDICTNAKVDDIIKIFKDTGKANKNYFSYHIKDGEYTYDITSYRKELEYKKNKPVKLEYAKDLKTDLLRRDFTINTFALDHNGNLIDILGAKEDLDNRIIRVVGDTEEKLLEDKRIMELEYNLICEFIKLRNELGLSQQKMADTSGVVREMIAVIENRKKHPQINTLIKILEPFGYTLSITKIKEEQNNEK